LDLLGGLKPTVMFEELYFHELGGGARKEDP